MVSKCPLHSSDLWSTYQRTLRSSIFCIDSGESTLACAMSKTVCARFSSSALELKRNEQGAPFHRPAIKPAVSTTTTAQIPLFYLRLSAETRPGHENRARSAQFVTRKRQMFTWVHSSVLLCLQKRLRLVFSWQRFGFETHGDTFCAGPALCLINVVPSVCLPRKKTSSCSLSFHLCARAPRCLLRLYQWDPGDILVCMLSNERTRLAPHCPIQSSNVRTVS